MTPKEKAKAIFNRYFIISGFFSDARKSSLICVDEILKEINYAKIDDTDRSLDNDLDYFEYWQEVKQEIKKL